MLSAAAAGDDAPGPAAYHFFTPARLVTFRAAAACIVPADGDSSGADSDRAVAIADRALAARPAADQRLLGVFLGALERLPLLRYGRPFSRLRPEQREAVLRFLESNRMLRPLRQGFFGVKTFALMGYYGAEETWGALGYPGPRQDAPYYQRRRDSGDSVEAS